MRAVLAAAASYFGAVFALGFVLGVLRTLVLLPVMLAASRWIAGRLRRRWPLLPGPALAMGGLAFGLLMHAEAAISLASGRTLVEHLALYTGAAHQLGLAGQFAFAVFPWWRARLDAQLAGSAARP